jgi:hypothetical protein
MANDSPIICLKEKAALKEVNKCVRAIVGSRRMRKDAPLMVLPHFQFKDELMAQAMTAALYATLVELLKEQVLLRDMRSAGWKEGERKLILAVGVSSAELDDVLSRM